MLSCKYLSAAYALFSTTSSAHHVSAFFVSKFCEMKFSFRYRNCCRLLQICSHFNHHTTPHSLLSAPLPVVLEKHNAMLMLKPTHGAVTDGKISGNWHQRASWISQTASNWWSLAPLGGSPWGPLKGKTLSLGGAKWAQRFWPKTLQRSSGEVLSDKGHKASCIFCCTKVAPFWLEQLRLKALGGWVGCQSGLVSFHLIQPVGNVGSAEPCKKTAL